MTGVWSNVLTVTGVIAVVFTLLQIRQARKAWHAQTFSKVVARWNEASFLDARVTIYSYAVGTPNVLKDKMVEWRAARNLDFWRLQTVLDYFENLSELVNYGAITIDMVDSTLGNLVCKYWGYWKPYVYAEREQEGEGLYGEFEKLAKRISDRHWHEDPWTFKGCKPPPKENPKVISLPLLRWRVVEVTATKRGTHPASKGFTLRLFRWRVEVKAIEKKTYPVAKGFTLRLFRWRVELKVSRW